LKISDILGFHKLTLIICRELESFIIIYSC